MKSIWIVLLSVAWMWAAVEPLQAASGKSGEKDGRVLSKITFIHFRRAPAKPPWAGGGGGGGGGGKKGKDTGHYAFIANGLRWRTTESYKLNPVNGGGLTDAEVEDSVLLALLEWEKYGGEIFGTLSIDYSAHYNGSTIDGVNAISFGTFSDPNVIGVTTIWGYFWGPPKSREIVETDLLFNTAYTWGDAAVNPNVMDLLNIAVHEVGHCAGMDDLYDTAAIEETMYGYSSEGETSKRDLFTGDITGIKKLYGVK